MALTIGTHLGSHEITALIGKGGMGEVYRARDTKLGRDVALKLLPEHFADDPDRLSRFQREAQVLASLNHPNIAQIYGLEESGNVRCIVMELVEGETLSGPVPIEIAIKYARQIAEALEYAHERGVVHRDLKPANIKVTTEGTVKLLDFGLAKATEDPARESEDPSNSPTLTLGATHVDVVLGTAAYMSPEQANGKSVDKRADIWSFGAVLYETLSGKKAFEGESVSDTLAAVIKLEPDWNALPHDVPASIHKLVRRCLTKDRKQRLRDIGEVRIAIEEHLANPHSEAEVPGRSETPAWNLPWILAAAGIAAALMVSLLYFRDSRPQERVQRYTIALPENMTNLHSFAISPDGHLVAIAADVNGKRQLWLRALDAPQAQPMPFTEDASYPFWSPDSRYIGFFGQEKLKKIAASGGPAETLCDDVPGGRGGSWNREDVIVFSSGGVTGPNAPAIKRLSAAGGVPIEMAKTKGISRFPVFLPNGRDFLYLLTGLSAEHNGVYLSSLDGKENRRVLADQSSVVLASGRLLFIRQNTLMAQPFEARTGQAIGEVFPVAENVSFINVSEYAPITVSETGVLLYESGGAAFGENQMVWYDRGGKLLGAIGAPGFNLEPAISPDERSVVFRRQVAATYSLRGFADLWLLDLTRGTERRFTTDASPKIAPFWSPKGDRIVFGSTRGGRVVNLYQRAVGGTGQDELLLANVNSKRPYQWSRDGRFIVYSELDPKTKYDIWVLPMDGGAEQKSVSFLHSEFNELFGQLSPDSRWMAYTSDETERREVYVRPFPDGEGQWKISLAGGSQPRWRGDGKELFFVGADGKMMAVALKAEALSGPGIKRSFEPGLPQALFGEHLFGGPLEFEYDVTADGMRFLLNTITADPTSGPSLNVVLNWTKS